MSPITLRRIRSFVAVADLRRRQPFSAGAPLWPPCPLSPPNILAAFMKEHPGIVVQVRDERTEVIEMRVRRGEVDFAISSRTDRDSEIEFEHIVDDPYFSVFPRTHKLAEGTNIYLEAL